MRRLAVPEYRVAEQIVKSLAITAPKSTTDAQPTIQASCVECLMLTQRNRAKKNNERKQRDKHQPLLDVIRPSR